MSVVNLKKHGFETIREKFLSYGGEYVAALYGCTKQDVSAFLRSNGVPPIPPEQRRYRDDIKVSDVVELKKQRLSFQQIGRKLGCSEYCARKRFEQWKKKHCLNNQIPVELFNFSVEELRGLKYKIDHLLSCYGDEHVSAE